jgi:predicted dehydrogenase
VHLDASASPYSRAGLRQDGWDETIQINGEHGRIEVFYVIWDKPLSNAPMVRYYSERDKTQTDFVFPKVNAFDEQIRTFVDNCEKGVKSVPGATEGYLVDRVISACYRSADSKQAVVI